MWITALLLGLVFSLPHLVVPAWAVMRTAPTPDAWRQAQARMADERPMPGTDAFDALYLLDMKVPRHMRRALVDADLSNRDLEERGQAAMRAGMPSVVPPLGALLRDCQPGDDCIAAVRAGRDDVVASLSVSHGLADNLVDLHRHGHVAHRPMLRADVRPMPTLLPGVAAVAHALSFVDGDRHGAIAGACGDLVFWRRLAANSTSMPATRMATRTVDMHAMVFANALARLPRGAALPAECAAATMPPSAGEGDPRPALLGVYREFEADNVLRFGADPLWKYVAMAPRADAPRIAAWLDAQGTPERLADIAADRPSPERSPAEHGLDWRCAAHLSACRFVFDVSSRLSDWTREMRDYRASLQLLSAVAWLQGQADADGGIDAQLARWPGQWAAPARQVRAMSRERISIAMHTVGNPVPDGVATLMVPGSRIEAPRAVDSPPEAAGGTAVDVRHAEQRRRIDAARARAERLYRARSDRR